jgi:hypothetical protein
MKRGIEDQARNSLPPQLRVQQQTSVAPIDARLLFDPIPGRENHDVQYALQELARNSNDPIEREAANALLLLLTKNQHPADISRETCQRAANQLLKLGQARLLCCLATLKPMRYSFAVAASGQDAKVLARATNWPPQVPVTLEISTRASQGLAHDLQSFLKRPQGVDVKLLSDGAGDPQGVKALATALKSRPLERLIIAQPANAAPEELPADVLKELCGTKADTIVLEHTALSSDAHADRLVALVQQSDATQLSIAAPGISGSLAARLLACRSKWSEVIVTESNEVMAQLQLGAQQIDRLGLASNRRGIARRPDINPQRGWAQPARPGSSGWFGDELTPAGNALVKAHWPHRMTACARLLVSATLIGRDC